MTNEAIAAGFLAGGMNTPTRYEWFMTRILTCKGTTDVPAGGCGVGCTSLGTALYNYAADLICANGCDTPQDVEEVGTIVLVTGTRATNPAGNF